MTSRFAAEIEVSRRLTKLLEDGESLRDLCARNNIAIPEALSRLLGMTVAEFTAATASPSTRMTYPPMPSPPRPENAAHSWIWIDEKDSTVTSLVLAWLRHSPGPSSPSEIYAGVITARPGVNKGSIANMGTRLEEAGVIRRSEAGWELIERGIAPMMHHGNLWGPPEAFDKYDLAVYRRNAIKHILGAAPDGLQVMQLTNALKESCPWFNEEIPVSKDLLKADIQELDKEKAIRRVGNSGKWELTK